MPVAPVRPFSDWPEVICGPMLRRVTATSVSVMVALKQQRAVTLRIFDHRQWTSTGSGAIGEATAMPRALGRRLFVAVITVSFDPHQPATHLQAGVGYGYDISLAGLPDSLKGLGLLTGDHALGYVDDLLPGFSLPSKASALKVAHGSCRKPHGEGADALVLLDAQIEAAREQPEDRPHLLFLTGDQIYADDVALPLADTILATQPDLLGWNAPEALQRRDGSPRLEFGAPELTPGPARAREVQRRTGFTSGKCEGHLLFLGDFYAMYLLVWSDELWPRDEEGRPTLFYEAHDEGGGLYAGLADLAELVRSWFWEGGLIESTLRDAMTLVGGHEASVRERLEAFREALPRARRALANVPTLMIFDDHDVTDDWNLHRRWVEDVASSDFGSVVLRNALAAYAVFQDWGNRPEHYAPGQPGHELFSYIECDASFNPPLLGEHLERLLGVGSLQAAGNLPGRLRYDYTIDLAPLPVQIVAFDSRTSREFPAGPDNANAALIRLDQLDRVLPVPATENGDRLLLVLAAAPVLGSPIWEEVLQRVAVLPRNVSSCLDGTTGVDNEAWGGDRGRFEAVLRRMAAYRQVAIFSGDVHFGYTSELSWFGESEVPSRSGPTTGRIVQFNSSALKNQDVGTQALQFIGHQAPLDDPNELMFKWLGWSSLTAAERMLLTGSVVQAVANPLEGGGSRKPLVGMWLGASGLERILTDPVVVPLENWGELTPVVVFGALLTEADWAYTVRYARDADPSLLSGGEIVGANNIGLVRFAGFGTLPDAATHRLSGLGPGGVRLTEHAITLSPPQDHERPPP